LVHWFSVETGNASLLNPADSRAAPLALVVAPDDGQFGETNFARLEG
jgi:hypothetical protein